MYFHLLVEDFIGFVIIEKTIGGYIASVVKGDAYRFHEVFFAEIGMISLI